MSEKSGSQVRTDDIVEGRANAHTGPAELFGVEVELVNGTITKRGWQAAHRRKLGVSDRQSRAAVSSYIARGLTDHAPGTKPRINDSIAKVSSAARELLELADRRADASVENGRKHRPAERKGSDGNATPARG